MQKEDYDLVIDLHKNIRTTKVKFWLSAPTITFDKKNVKKWKLVNFKNNKLQIRHLIDRYFDAVKSLGISNDGAGMDFFLTPEKNIQKIKNPYVVLMIGAAHYTKQIPTDLCEVIIKGIKLKIVLIGGEGEITKGKKLESLQNVSVNLVGKVSLQASARVVLNAEAVITGDTGIMHMSAALQKPIISIWG